jgi:hypothetical protein
MQSAAAMSTNIDAKQVASHTCFIVTLRCGSMIAAFSALARDDSD